MAKRKPTVDQEVVVALDPVYYIGKPNLAPLVDEAIAKIQSIDSVGHMFYVKQRVEEAIVLLQALKSQISDA